VRISTLRGESPYTLAAIGLNPSRRFCFAVVAEIPVLKGHPIMESESTQSTPPSAETHTATPLEPTANQRPEADKSGKVTFDEKQQAKLEELLAKMRHETAKTLREENAALQRELERARQAALLPQSTAEELAATSERLAAARAELQSIEQRKLDDLKLATLQAAAEAADFMDAGIGAQLMANSVQLISGEFTVVSPKNGAPRLNAHGDPMTVAELAAEIGTRHRYLVKSTLRGGSGSHVAMEPAPSGPPIESLFGARSNGAAAQKYHREHPAEYRRLREQARQKGLL